MIDNQTCFRHCHVITPFVKNASDLLSIRKTWLSVHHVRLSIRFDRYQARPDLIFTWIYICTYIQGDPSWLDTSEAILRALDKARNIHLDQGQGQPGLAEDKKSNQGAMLSSSPPGSVVTCFDCNINLDSDSLSKYCLHCQKV